MKIVVCNTYDELSQYIADRVAGLVNENPECILGLATGSTPVGMYNNLIELYKKGELDFSQVKSFNLDEYYPIARDNRQSYRYFMDKLAKDADSKYTIINFDLPWNPQRIEQRIGRCHRYGQQNDE